MIMRILRSIGKCYRKDNWIELLAQSAATSTVLSS
jgi:hypothetical protein